MCGMQLTEDDGVLQPDQLRADMLEREQLGRGCTRREVHVARRDEWMVGVSTNDAGRLSNTKRNSLHAGGSMVAAPPPLDRSNAMHGETTTPSASAPATWTTAGACLQTP